MQPGPRRLQLVEREGSQQEGLALEEAHGYPEGDGLGWVCWMELRCEVCLMIGRPNRTHVCNVYYTYS